MYKDIKDYNYSLRGTDYILLLGALLALVGVCVVGYAIRWVEFCNMSDDPYTQAGINIALICASGVICSLACAADTEAKRAYSGALFVGVYLMILPTTMFFGEYLAANLFFCMAFYRMMRFSARKNTKGNIFFATFWILIGSIFIPQTIFLLVWIYLAIAIFAIEDVRNFFVPLIAMLTFGIYYTTYATINGEDVWAVVRLFSAERFELPYTDKFFSVYNYYFYWAGLAIVLLYAMWSYFLYCHTNTLIYQKRFIAIFAAFTMILGVVIFFPQHKYLNVFFIMPFVILLNNFFYQSNSSVKKEIISWYFGILCVLSMWLFK